MGSVPGFRQSAKPFAIATYTYYTGIDPFTKQAVYVAQHLRDRKLQRALLQFFKPENYFMVREALIQAGRADLIGGGCDCLIPANPLREAIEARRRQADETARGDYVHKVPSPSQGKRKGYRPGRKRGGRQEKRKDGGAALGP